MKTKAIFCFYALIFFSCTEKTTNEEQEMTIQDPHSYAIPEESKVTHLDWAASVNFQNKVINATAVLHLENSKDAAKVMLDTKGLNITSVKSNGEDMDYSLGDYDKHLGRSLEVAITPDTKTITVNYTTSKAAEALQWLDPVQTADGNGPFLFTQSQAILARSWVPIQDSPGIRFTYNATVKVPQGMMALMSAENPQKVSADGQYSFKMEEPIPAYLLALSVGYVEFVSLGERSGVYAEPSVLDKAAYEFGDLEKMITAAEDLYGPYKWGRYDIIVLPPSFPFGGMENPRLTFATPTILAGDRSLTSLVAHELAHSWSGNLVTNATWNDFWLNEGFTVYFEHRIMESLYGRDYSEMLASLAAQDLQDEIAEMIADDNAKDTHLKLELEGRNPDDGVTSIAYDKGYFFLRYLEEKVGREKWDAFVKQYFTENAFKVMTTEAFIEYLETNLIDKERINIGTVKINEWIYQPGLPDDAVIPESDRFEKVDKEMNRFVQGTPAEELESEEWSSHEWLHFVRAIPDTMKIAELKELDDQFGFTKTGNSEVLAAWLVQSVKHEYESAYGRLETFLINTGRRKFLSPIYGELVKTEAGTKMAREVYEKARPNYHFVATNTIDEMLK
ncbi:M1 family peptidase [Fulvivirga sp. RKSG066]|uniref:M1 family metallopeptidase n=1 Tax=Fulvivirga aurantia TaxID=2529383 RepID=UPI0012BBAAA5|nr:M1 family metallopeptidase [Fulvivirga aurantia]MTI22332.1 M1 family peptidase [Fulvivirga aurantia]